MEVSGRKKFPYEGEEAEEIFCQPCRGDGDNVQAEGYCETCNEYFCSSCIKFHRKQSVTKNHVIKLKDEMPRAQVQIELCSELCGKHGKEIVKFYCQGHGEVGCGDCMVLDHKTCKVRMVPDVSRNYCNSEDFKNIKIRMEQLENLVAAKKREIRENLRSEEDVKNKVIKEIKMFRSELNGYLDSAEAEIIEEIEELNAKNVSMMKNMQTKFEEIENEIQGFQSKIDESSDKINQLFVTVKLAQSRLQKYEEVAKRMASEGNVNGYVFEPSRNLLSLKVSQNCMGTLTLQKRKRLSKDLAEMDAQFVQTFHNKCIGEAKNCYITGMASISKEEILLVDKNNKSIKILNVKDDKIISVYKPEAAPWDVTVIQQGKAAVSIPTMGKILVLNTEGSLSENHFLKVREGCRGIDHRDGVIAVTFCGPSAVQILSLDGDILHYVNDASLLTTPLYIALSTDNKSMYVSDYGKGSVYEVTIQGQYIAEMKHEKMKGPAGLAVTRDGTVAVCCSDVNDSILVTQPNTREVRPLALRRVKRPVAVLVCQELDKLYTSSSLDSKDCHSIKSFSLK